ncbi:MAG TPA: LysM peptidoglycan-binding domain-containing protein, partial [Anaerolineae bacterium]|nr:LysM peptidoglycan-binding domain-containing protein [Anaerolineae bacterium]
MSKPRLGQSAYRMFGEAAGSSPDSNMAQLLGSLALTFISVGMLLGGFLLSQLDASGMRPSPPTQEVSIPWPSPTIFLPTITPLPSPTLSPIPPQPATEPAAETGVPPTIAPSVSPTSPYASPTPRPYTCGPPLDWIVYYVQQGDTLYSLAQRCDVSIEAIRWANCLPANENTIYAGQALFLPRPPPTRTYTPAPLPTLTPTETPTPTHTPTPVPT